MDSWSNQTCSYDALEYFSENIGLEESIMRVNALMAFNGALMGFMVWIGTYGQRYRHSQLIRFLILAATTLFLPIVSYVVSSSGVGVGKSNKILYDDEFGLIEGYCDAGNHIIIILVWTGLVLNIGINSTAIVAADAREGRNIPPNTVLLIQAMWTSYLAVYTAKVIGNFFSLKRLIALVGVFVVIFAKLLLKCYAWYTARQSLALGCNPRLIVGYMEQLQHGSHHDELASEHIPPPLIVTGEHTVQVQEKPHGYKFKWMSNRVTGDMQNNGLVTFDKVWQLNDTLLRSKALQLKDLCFSFALFKMLRCRIARYTIVEVGFIKARNFLGQMLLEDNDCDRVLAVIAHELSFLHDYYYSSLSISYSKSWLPILSILISLLSIAYCLFIIIALSPFVIFVITGTNLERRKGQINCDVYCNDISSDTPRFVEFGNRTGSWKSFGSPYFDIVPLYILAALVMLAEVRDIASYIYSNWTKVALICHYVKHSSWLQSPTMQRYVGCVLESKGKLIKNWEDKMSQSSVLVLHPRKSPVALLHRLIHLSGQNKKVPSAVKAAIVGVLRSHEGCRINGTMASLKRSQHLRAGDETLWTFDGAKGTAEIMLVCHIATTILETRSHPHQDLSDHKIAASHISQYCAYLVAYSPELLPEDDEWCKSLYKAVKKDAKLVLLRNDFRASRVSEPEYQKRLIEMLSAECNHDVLKDGARLAERLAGLSEGDETAWKALAIFWSEMILYVAPSDNIDGHVKAIARGGELITLVWALVTHLGIVGRSDDTIDDAVDILSV